MKKILKRITTGIMMQPSINDMLTVTDSTVAAKGLVDRLSTSTGTSSLEEKFSNLVSELKGTEQFKLEVVKKAQKIVAEQASSEVNSTALPVNDEGQQALLQSFDAVKGMLNEILNEGDSNSSNDLIKQVLYSKGGSGNSISSPQDTVGQATTDHQGVNVGVTGEVMEGKVSIEKGVSLPFANKGSNSTTQAKGMSDVPFHGVDVRFNESGQEGVESALKGSNFEVLNHTKTEGLDGASDESQEKYAGLGLVGTNEKLSVRQAQQKDSQSEVVDSAVRGEGSGVFGSPLNQNKSLSENSIESFDNKQRILTADSKVKSALISFENGTQGSRKEVLKQGVLKDVGEVTESINQQAQKALSKQDSQALKKGFVLEVPASDERKLPIYQAKRFGQGFVDSTEVRDGLNVQTVSTAKDSFGMASSRFTPLVADISSSSYQEFASQESHDVQVDAKRVTELQSLQKIEKLSGDINSAKVEAKLAELGLVIKQAALGRIRSLNITLKPVELGSVEVAIDDVGGEIHIKMSAEKIETLETLQKQESEMRQSLSQQNATFSFSQQNSSNRKFSLGDHLKSNETDDSTRDDGMSQIEYVEEGRLRITI